MSSLALEFLDQKYYLKIIFIKAAEFGAEVQREFIYCANKRSSFIAHPGECHTINALLQVIAAIDTPATTHSCSGIDLNTCNGVSGCHVKILTQQTAIQMILRDLTPYGQTEFSKKFMFMECRGDPGDVCQRQFRL